MKKLPAEFEQRIRQTHADAQEFLDAISNEPFYSIRLNTRKPAQLSLDLSDRVQWCDDAYYLSTRPNYTLMPEFHAGAIYPQEASSMFLRTIFNNINSELPQQPIVLDLCAAPGGKSTLVAQFLNGRGLLVANEYIRSRAWILAENVTKQGFANTMITNGDAASFAQLGAMFDVVLIDAPCSGEGMFRKDDVAIAEWTPANANMCANRQREIIENIADSIVEGGYMIYSTCTFNPAENEENMQWLLDNYDFENIQIPISENSGITTLHFKNGEGYAFYPHKVRGEGFFVCVMRKTSGRKRKQLKLPKMQKGLASNNIINSDRYNFYIIDNKQIAIPNETSETAVALSSALRPLRTGIEVSEVTRKGDAPSPTLPLSLAFNHESLPLLNVDRDAALKFLHGDALASAELPQGWFVVQHNGLALGLCKSVGSRANNYYPKEWRIRSNV